MAPYSSGIFFSSSFLFPASKWALQNLRQTNGSNVSQIKIAVLKNRKKSDDLGTWSFKATERLQIRLAETIYCHRHNIITLWYYVMSVFITHGAALSKIRKIRISLQNTSPECRLYIVASCRIRCQDLHFLFIDYTKQWGTCTNSINITQWAQRKLHCSTRSLLPIHCLIDSINRLWHKGSKVPSCFISCALRVRDCSVTVT